MVNRKGVSTIALELEHPLDGFKPSAGRDECDDKNRL